MKVQPARSYCGAVTPGSLLRGTDGKTAFKLYYVDIVGRAEPARYEWQHCGMSKSEREQAMLSWPGLSSARWGGLTALSAAC